MCGDRINLRYVVQVSQLPKTNPHPMHPIQAEQPLLNRQLKLTYRYRRKVDEVGVGGYSQ